MINKGSGSVEVWSYSEGDIVNYVRQKRDPKLTIEFQYGNWETGSESWKKVWVARK